MKNRVAKGIHIFNKYSRIKMMSQLTLNMKNLTMKNLREVSFKGALVQ